MRSRLCNACKKWNPVSDWSWGCPECGHDNRNRASQHVMPDIKPYQSMVTGEMITSRSKHREHLKQHDCIEIGNETKYLTPSKAPLPEGRKELIINQMQQWGHDGYKKALNKEIEYIKWNSNNLPRSK